MEALGLIENKSYLSSVIAADTALKAADVTLINIEIIKGGYVTVQLIGDVAAVRAAVDAGTESVESFGTLISSHVIPRMHMETHQLIEKLPIQESNRNETKYSPEAVEQEKQPEKEETEAPLREAEPEESETAAAVNKDDAGKAEEPLTKPVQDGASALYREDLEKMTVGKLRQLVRERKAMEDNTKNIKYAKKAELISSLVENDEVYDSDIKG
jgi:microcompartment protein CcmL/EutN